MNSPASKTAINKSVATLAAIALILGEQSVGRAQNIVIENDCKSITDCMAPLYSFRSSMYPTASYAMKTAVALFNKGYYAESIPWFEKSAYSRDLWYKLEKGQPIEILSFPEHVLDWAIAYEKLGQNDNALATLAHGNAGWCALPHIRLLLKLGKCQDAGDLCDIRLKQINELGIPSSYKQERAKLAFLKRKAAEGKAYDSTEPFVRAISSTDADSKPRKEIAELANSLDMADAKFATASETFSNLDLLAKLLLKRGRYQKCIKLINQLPQSEMKQRDKNYWNLLLAQAYLLDKQYNQAIATANLVAKQEKFADIKEICKMWIGFDTLDRMSAQAHLIRAAAEHALGNETKAEADALLAEREFLDISRIDCRDIVQNWRKENIKQTSNLTTVRKEKRTKMADQNNGTLNIQLLESEELGVYISPSSAPIHPSLRQIERLVAIDDKPLKGLSLDTIYALLPGPVGSKVTLQVLTDTNQIVPITVERQLPETKTNTQNAINQIKTAADLLDYFNDADLPRTYHNVVSGLEQIGSETYATALTHASMQVCEHWFDANSLTAAQTLLQAAMYFDRVGRIPEADAAIERALSAISHLASSQFQEQIVLIGFAKHLADTGRKQQSEVVYRKLLDCAQKYDSTPSKLAAVQRDYAAFLGRQDRQQEAASIYDQMLQLPEQNLGSKDFLLAAESYCSNGQYQKGIDTFQLVISKGLKTVSDSQQVGNRERPLLTAIYKQACAYQSMSRPDQAVDALKSALNVYQTRFDKYKQIETEKLPFFFPTMSDIETKLAEMMVAKKDYDSAILLLNSATAKIKIALGDTSPYLAAPLTLLELIYEARGETQEAKNAAKQKANLRQLEHSTPQERTSDYQLMSRCNELLKAKDFVALQKLLDQHLTTLESLDERTDEKRRKSSICNFLSYFCSLLIDNERYEDAKEIADRMTNCLKVSDEYPVALFGITVEKALFADKLGLPVEESWKEVEQILPADKLRNWSQGYYFSGDLKRAGKLLAHIKASSTDDPTSAFLADWALLEIKLSHVDDAQATVAKILNYPRNISPITGYKLSLISAAYQNSKHSSAAKQLLRQAIQKEINPVNQTSREGLPALFRLNLAKLLCEENSYQEAGALLSEVEAKMGNSQPQAEFLLCSAEIESKLGNHKQAAQQLFQAQKAFYIIASLDPSMMDIKRQILKRAADEASKAKTLDAKEHASILTALAECYLNRDRGEATTVYKQAQALLPDDSPESANIAQMLARLTVGSPAGSDNTLEALEKAAIFAKKAQLETSYWTWLELATNEIQAGKLKEAEEHLVHALELFKNNGKKEATFRPPITNRGIAAALRAKGKDALAEHLLKEAAQISQSIYGADSCEYSESLCELALFCATKKSDTETAELVEKILQLYLKQNARPQPASTSKINESIRRLYEVTELQSKQGRDKEAIALASKILDVQQKQLPADNIQLVQTLATLGALYKKAGEYQKAEPLYKEAVRIEKLHWGESRSTLYYRSEYADILRKLGRLSEADRLLAEHGVLAPQIESLHEQISRVETDARRLKTDQDPQKTSELLERHYSQMKSIAPYSEFTIMALHNIAEFYLRQNDLGKAKESFKEMLRLAKKGGREDGRRDLNFKGKILDICIKENNTHEALEALADLKASDPAYNSNLKSVDCLLRYARLEIAVGQKAEAETHVAQAEQLLAEMKDLRHSNATMSQSTLATLWQQLGQAEKAALAQKKLEKLRSENPRSEHRPLNRYRATSADRPASTANNQGQNYFALYMADIERRIKRAWFPPKGFEDRRITITFKVSKNGDVSEIQITKASGIELADQAALNATKNAAPFRQLPPDVSESQQFEMTFAFNPSPGSGDGAIRRI